MKMKSVIAGEYTAPPAHGPMMHGDLRHHAGGHHVAQEDVGVAGERHDAFLDARAARIVDADHRASGLHREVHDLADLLGERAREAAAEDREVLREDADLAAVDGAVAGDHAVAGDLLAGPSRSRSQRWVLNLSSSTKEPRSSRKSMRSRAVKRPDSCCLAMPILAAAELRLARKLLILSIFSLTLIAKSRASEHDMVRCVRRARAFGRAFGVDWPSRVAQRAATLQLSRAHTIMSQLRAEKGRAQP